jgi:hypothetical protein
VQALCGGVNILIGFNCNKWKGLADLESSRLKKANGHARITVSS